MHITSNLFDKTMTQYNLQTGLYFTCQAWFTLHYDEYRYEVKFDKR